MSVVFKNQDNAYFRAASGSGTKDDPFVYEAGTVTVSPTLSGTATAANVPASATVVTLLAANGSRNGAAAYNDSSAILYLKLGSGASATSFTVAMAAGSYYEVPANYTGIITGLWASATGAARVTEFTT